MFIFSSSLLCKSKVSDTKVYLTIPTGILPGRASQCMDRVNLKEGTPPKTDTSPSENRTGPQRRFYGSNNVQGRHVNFELEGTPIFGHLNHLGIG